VTPSRDRAAGLRPDPAPWQRHHDHRLSNVADRMTLSCLRRRGAILLLTCLLAAGALATQSPQAHALTSAQIFGIGDQNDPDMFADPLFTALKPGATRYIADLDTARTPGWARDQLDAWYAAASASNMRMLIALQQFKRTRVPTDAQYARGLRAFLARYPKVREYAAFNEANHITQPLYRRPEAAAHLAHLARVVCPQCTIVGLTLVLGFGNDIDYARRFRAALPRADRPRLIWGVSSYGDTNRRTNTRMARFIKAFPTGRIWVTEAAAWAQFAKPTWPFNLVRQGRRTTNVFTQALLFRHRIARLYWYEWRGGGNNDERWDSGLLHPDGRPRPAYREAMRQRFRTH
jgi:hypothetical protein